VAEDGSGTGAAGAASLPDKIALGVLTRLVTRELVEDVLVETGRKEQRKRLLPARVVVYFVLALALFYGDSYEEVMRKLVQGLSWLSIWKKEWHVPTSSAFTQARERLGSEPLRELFERAAVPCAQRSTAGAWLCGRLLMSIDGVELDVADTTANTQHFGRRRGKNGNAAFPRVLVMALAECGTHAIVAAETATAGTGEVPLARALASAPGNLGPGMLVLADRGLYSYKMITAVAAAGKRADRIARRLLTEVVLPMVKGAERLTLALDDTPTKRYGPHVQGAGTHHNPAPGPAGSPYVYGHVFVVLAVLVTHPAWGVIALPLLARLYVRKKDLPAIDPKHRPAFRTKLELAVEMLRWAKPWLGLLKKPIWVVADGAYAKKDFLEPAAALGQQPLRLPRPDRRLQHPRHPRTGRQTLDRRRGNRRGCLCGRRLHNAPTTVPWGRHPSV